MKKKYDTDECSFCHITGDIQHALWNCKYTKSMIQNLKECVNTPKLYDIKSTCHGFLFGSDIMRRNNLTLLCKYFIWYLRKDLRS